jgi:hypothetical protein
MGFPLFCALKKALRGEQQFLGIFKQKKGNYFFS